jgi:hypothetical protein
VGSPAHGTLTGTPPNLRYEPASDFAGFDSFTYKASDGRLESALLTVGITVRSVNDVPVGKITILPLTQLTGLAEPAVLAPLCSSAKVILDGSRSNDRENDRLQYHWWEGTNSLGTSALVTSSFIPGDHIVALQISDAQDSVTVTVTFKVVTPAEAVEFLLNAVDQESLALRDTKPLRSRLQDSIGSFERCRLKSGIDKLTGFQDKVRERLTATHPALAGMWISSAQAIIDAAMGKPVANGASFSEVGRRGDGTLILRFTGHTGLGIVQASTNLIDWENLGVAEAQSDGSFLFQDPTGKHAHRFYRLVSPP